MAILRTCPNMTLAVERDYFVTVSVWASKTIIVWQSFVTISTISENRVSVSDEEGIYNGYAT